MKAIVEINGKQYEVEEGRYVQIDSYRADENQEVVLGNVCLVVAGEKSLVGAPYVDGATVKARIKRHARGPKVLVYKMRCKKGYRRKNGHRQGFTELQVVQIDFAGRDAFGPVPQAVEAPKREKAVKAQAVEAPAKPKAEAKPKATPKAKSEESGEAKPKAKKAAAPKAAKKPAPKAEAPAVDTPATDAAE